jgi:hypothetical protein
MTLTLASAPAMIKTRTMLSIISRAVTPRPLGAALEVFGGFKADSDIPISHAERPGGIILFDR